MVFVNRLISLAILWRRIPAVIKSVGIRRPSSTRELGPLDKISGIIAGFYIADMPSLPVRARTLDGISKPCPARRHAGSCKCRCAIGRKEVWIEEHTPAIRRSIPHKQLGLVGKPWVVRPEPLATFLPRHANTLIVPEVTETFPKRIPSSKCPQIRHRHCILCCDPGCCFIRIRILKPAVRVSDFIAMDDIHDVLAAGYRILHWPRYS